MGMLQHAAQNKPGTNAAAAEGNEAAAGNDGEVNVANFRTHKQDMADKKNRAQ